MAAVLPYTVTLKHTDDQLRLATSTPPSLATPPSPPQSPPTDSRERLSGVSEIVHETSGDQVCKKRRKQSHPTSVMNLCTDGENDKSSGAVQSDDDVRPVSVLTESRSTPVRELEGMSNNNTSLITPAAFFFPQLSSSPYRRSPPVPLDLPSGTRGLPQDLPLGVPGTLDFAPGTRGEVPDLPPGTYVQGNLDVSSGARGDDEQSYSEEGEMEGGVEGEEEGPEICPQCKKSFKRRVYLQRHMAREHWCLAKVFKCEKCAYETKHQSNLLVHRRTHTGERPYHCGACGQRYTQGHLLKAHIRSRHNSDMRFYNMDKRTDGIRCRRSLLANQKNGATLLAGGGVLGGASDTENLMGRANGLFSGFMSGNPGLNLGGANLASALENSDKIRFLLKASTNGNIMSDQDFNAALLKAGKYGPVGEMSGVKELGERNNGGFGSTSGSPFRGDRSADLFNNILSHSKNFKQFQSPERVSNSTADAKSDRIKFLLEAVEAAKRRDSFPHDVSPPAAAVAATAGLPLINSSLVLRDQQLNTSSSSYSSGSYSSSELSKYMNALTACLPPTAATGIRPLLWPQSSLTDSLKQSGLFNSSFTLPPLPPLPASLLLNYNQSVRGQSTTESNQSVRSVTGSPVCKSVCSPDTRAHEERSMSRQSTTSEHLMECDGVQDLRMMSGGRVSDVSEREMSSERREEMRHDRDMKRDLNVDSEEKSVHIDRVRRALDLSMPSSNHMTPSKNDCNEVSDWMDAIPDAVRRQVNSDYSRLSQSGDIQDGRKQQPREGAVCEGDCCHYKKLKSLRRDVLKMLRVFAPYLGAVGGEDDNNCCEEDSIDQFLHEVIYSRIDDSVSTD